MRPTDKMDAMCAQIGRDHGRKLRRMISVSLVRAVVESVDEDAHTVNAVVDDDKAFRDITLDVVPGGDNSVFLLPKIGSAVILGFIDGQPESPYVAKMTAVDKILIQVGETTIEVTDGLVKMNGGKNKGMVLIDALTQKLNALVTAFNAHTHQVSTTGTASAQTGTAAAIVSKAQNFNASDYENKNVTQ